MTENTIMDLFTDAVLLGDREWLDILRHFTEELVRNRMVSCAGLTHIEKPEYPIFFFGEISDQLWHFALDDSHTWWVSISEDATLHTHLISVSRLMQHFIGEKHHVLRDTLTGLPTRAIFEDRVAQAILKQTRSDRGSVFCVMIIDCDNLKQINDRYGHPAGDEVLRILASRMRHCLRQTDTLARFGGDEFVSLLNDVRDDACLLRVVKRMIDAANNPIEYGQHSLNISISVGIAMSPKHGNDFDTLYDCADKALYSVKHAGKNNYAFYDGSQQTREEVRLEHHDILRSAYLENRIFLEYQPIVSKDGVHALEGLVRVREGERTLSPALFLEGLNNPYIAAEVGRAIIHKALQDIVDIHKATGQICRLSINISPYHLESTGFSDEFLDLVVRTGTIKPEHIELEITETAPFHNFKQAQAEILRCAEAGAHVMLDDFGTGSASLSWLQTFSASGIKVDLSFVRRALTDAKSFAIIASIANVGALLGLDIVAEGIEDHYTASLLSGIGIKYFQGYLYSRPVSKLQAIDYINQFSGCSFMEVPAHIHPMLKAHYMRFLCTQSHVEHGNLLKEPEQSHFQKWLKASEKRLPNNIAAALLADFNALIALLRQAEDLPPSRDRDEIMLQAVELNSAMCLKI